MILPCASSRVVMRVEGYTGPVAMVEVWPLPYQDSASICQNKLARCVLAAVSTETFFRWKGHDRVDGGCIAASKPNRRLSGHLG